MALTASLYRSDRALGLDVHVGQDRERVRDDPPNGSRADWSAWVFEWDADALEDGRHDFLGLFLARLDRVTDAEIVALDRLALPHVTVPDLVLTDASISTVVRHARDALIGSATSRSA